MVYFFIPYSFEGDLGKAYNEYMRLIPNDDDWACLVDGDTMFMTPDWGHQVKELVEENPDVAVITCKTNRISNKHQRIHLPSQDILQHRKKASQMLRAYRGVVSKTNRHISGVMIIVRKSTWKKYPFPEIGSILNVDNVWSKKLIRKGEKIVIAQGLYLLHYYRWGEGRSSTAHLQTKEQRRNALARKKRKRREARLKRIRAMKNAT